MLAVCASLSVRESRGVGRRGEADFAVLDLKIAGVVVPALLCPHSLAEPSPQPRLPSEAFRMAFQQQPIALLSVYDKAGLLPLAQGLAENGVRLLGSGGTAKAIRNAGMNIE